MSNPLKTYLGTGSQTHTGSSGFTNYFGNKPNPMAVFRDFPAAIIVDGNDDWSAKKEMRPASVVQDAGIQPLAWFHSGISGITKSGVVLTPKSFAKLEAYYLREFKTPLGDLLTVYRYDPETDPRNLNNNLPCT
jgi:hypothetical protein